MGSRIQLRRDTAANWASVNPVLAQGEPGHEIGTGVFKFGDGVTAWLSLPDAARAYADAAIAAVVDASPGALDTLNELAAALGDDANFASTVNDAIAARATQVGLDAETDARIAGDDLRVLKASARLNAKDAPYNAVGNDVADDTAALQALIDDCSITGKEGEIPPGTYRYTKLRPKTGAVLAGHGISTRLRAIDPNAGWSIERLDDGSYIGGFGLRDMQIGPAFSSVATAQDSNQSLGGISNAGCAYTQMRNLTLHAFGAGAIVWARCEGGAEGLGFVNTTMDGNYSRVDNIRVAACGKYNADGAAFWLKYKANSNKMSALFVKGSFAAGVVIVYGDDNLISGAAFESGERGVWFKNLAFNNLVLQMRAEVLSISAIKVDAAAFPSSQVNTVIGVHQSTTPLLRELEAGARLRYIGGGGADFFSDLHTSNLGVNSDLGYVGVSGLLQEESMPLRIKTKGYNTATQVPRVEIHNTHNATVAGQVLGGLTIRNSDTTAGAPGVNAQVVGVCDDGVGNTGVAIYTGIGGVITEKFRVFAGGDVTLGRAALATTDTKGFTRLPSVAGTPTGVPVAITGNVSVPCVVDTAGSKLWAYIGGAWKSVPFT